MLEQAKKVCALTESYLLKLLFSKVQNDGSKLALVYTTYLCEVLIERSI